jgi:GNAT superfamily N-acetyltransferase
MSVSDKPAVNYSVYERTDAHSVCKLLAAVFPRHDPPAVAAGITTADFEQLVGLLCSRAPEQRLTIVARLGGTDEVIGALLTEDAALELPEAMYELSSNFHPIFDILGQLEDEYRRSHVIHPGECLHLFLLGVSDRVAGRGVAQQLVRECLRNGRARGYRVAVTEATNKTSQHIFAKEGFVARVQRSYAEHEFEGRRVFASIADHGGPMLMDKVL